MSKSGGLISDKTYRKLLKQIEYLIVGDPNPTSRNGRRLIRLVRMVQAYEKYHYSMNHSKRRLRGDL